MQQCPQSYRRRLLPLVQRIALALLPFLLAPLAASAAEPSGEQLFQAKCAVCHGAHGEGTKKHKAPLAGNRSAAQLRDLIAKTMPEDDPGTLSKPDAQAVATYVYDTIYSPVAQARNRPARIELARLTVNQYRQTTADLIGSFRGQPSAWNDQRGLKGEYFNNRNFDSNKLALERIDPQVKFDFGADSPVAGKIDAREFGMRWTGSVMAMESGEYDFTVRTDHAARLWVGQQQHPLIDAWVKSGNDTEYRATLSLLAGRIYPLRLEFSKAKQGVKDNKAKERPPAKASVALWWKRPFGVDEPIPARQLSPTWAPDAFVCTTPFPPDDRSYGWERGTTISKEWDEATTDAAIETAGYVVAHLNDLAGTRDDASDRAAKLKNFCRTFAERAFRRPLSAEETKTVVDRQFDAAQDPEIAVKRVVLRTLTSPRFLYREIGGEPDGYKVADRLSYGLWDSMPDQELLRAAASGQLSNKEQVAKQAERLLADPRAKAKIHAFLLTWAKADEPRDLAKDATKFPGFDPAVISDLRTSLELFLDDVAWSDKSDFRQLLTADTLFLNGRLAKFYGADLPADAGFTKVKLDADRRAGVLTHPYLMASFAHNKETSPILRGVFLARGVLAVSLRPPPAAFVPLSVELQPTLTTRERVSLQTKSDNCMACHGIINPLGFTLEHFDAVGQYREKDNGKPIDASGTYRTRSGTTATLKDARDLAKFLIDSDEAQTAFTEQMFHQLVQQPVQAYGPNTLGDLRRDFVAGGFNIRKLAIAIMAASALPPRETKIADAANVHK
jgi:cytochrome c553